MVLISEIVAARVIAPYVGITLETFSAVIGCVLAGISLGSWLGGVLSDRVAPRLLLGPVFVVGGLLLIASPFIVRSMGPDATASNPASALGLAVAGFFLPSVVLSAVSPAVVKMLGQGRPNLGVVAGGAVGHRHRGGLLGNFGAGFVLVGEFRSDQILIISGAACIVVGGLVALLSHRGVLSRSVAAVVILAGVAATTIDGRIPCDAETKYVCLNITAEGPQQYLISSNIYSSSFTDVANPTNLRFAYAKDVAGIVAARQQPGTAAPHRLRGRWGATRCRSTSTPCTRGPPTRCSRSTRSWSRRSTPRSPCPTCSTGSRPPSAMPGSSWPPPSRGVRRDRGRCVRRHLGAVAPDHARVPRGRRAAWRRAGVYVMNIIDYDDYHPPGRGPNHRGGVRRG